MSTTADSLRESAPHLVSISEDEAIFAYLKSSAAELPLSERQLLDDLDRIGTFGDRLACRNMCQGMGRLEYFRARHWYRARLTPRQLEFIRLGQESSNNFSKYFSEGTYRPCIAARRIERAEGLDEKRGAHRNRVVKLSETIDIEGLQDVILCASNYTVNRELKIFDGNHRLLAYALKYRRLSPFTCIVGFARPLYVGLMQRAMLGFPFYDEFRNAVAFAIRANARRLRSLFSGGVHYQPVFANGGDLSRLSASGAGELDDANPAIAISERRCTVRAKMLRDDMRTTIGDLTGSSLLDIGCNVGFFCHFFASLGMRATGVDNSQHNREQRFSLSNSIRTARKMNLRYGLAGEFIDGDAREWVKDQETTFDVVLLLSVLHHFFLGYPVGEYEADPMEEAIGFMREIARITGKVLYIEFEDVESNVSTAELLDFLRSLGSFSEVGILSYSDDFGRPIIRCVKS